jgi:hypothetical protein
MKIRYVIVTKEKFVSNLDDINVSKYWLFPKGNVLFDFYHPILEVVMETDALKRENEIKRRNKEFKIQMNDMEIARHRILKPLYDVVPDYSEQVLLHVLTETSYFFLGDNKKTMFPLKWRNSFKFISSGEEWWKFNNFNLLFNLDNSGLKKQMMILNVLREWGEVAIKSGFAKYVNPIEMNKSTIKVECLFSKYSEDALMGLLMMLTDEKKQIPLESIEVVNVG